MAGASPATTMIRMRRLAKAYHGSGILSGGQVTLAGAMVPHPIRLPVAFASRVNVGENQILGIARERL